jgi:hypothetical protein
MRWNYLGFAAVLVGGGIARGAGPVDFDRAIEPILADNCYPCHGPDPGGRKAGLRLDRAEVAFSVLKDHKRAIVPGDVDKSELLRRVTASDPDEHMPPSGHEALRAEQVEVLREWIAQGAKYRDHWAFEKPVRPEVPETKRAGWGKNPIDRFILAGLEGRGLSPRPEANKEELIRRVTLDLTGLLPTPAEVREFVGDRSADAYEKVVDRLLASPRYGEHRAHYWLDYARYGDTHGLHNDNYRDIWPYRDYVIRAFNSNKPYNQFVVEQLAGDLLPPTNLDQLLATGFVRCNLSTGEGGAINEEIRVSNARDRVEAYGTVFLGMTLGCAVCHDHKFDPVTQKDFYSLSAYFNNLAEHESNDDRFDPPPTVRMPKADKRDEYNRVLGEKARVLRKIEERQNKAAGLVQDWVDFDGGPRGVSTKDLDVRLRFDEGKGDVAINSAPGAKRREWKFGGAPPVWGEETWLWPGIRLDSTTTLSAPDVGDFEKDQGFSAGGWLQVRFNPTAIGDVNSGSLISRLDQPHGSRGWELWYENGSLIVHVVSKWPKDAIKVQTTTKIEKGEWRHVFFTYDGSGKAEGIRLFVDGKAQPLKVVTDSLSGSIRTTVPWELGRRHDGSAMKLTRFADVRVYSRALSNEEVGRLPYEDYVAEVVAKPAKTWNEDQRYVVDQFYLNQVDEEVRQYRRQVAELDKKLDAIAKGGEPAMVCQERPTEPEAHVLARGIYTARVERVRPAVPKFLRKSGEPVRDRLGLARWTVSDDNPLTARVEVNRMWQELFGVGLVETSGDFGMMGTRPSNPELLDWLAVEFKESGWDMKHMYRLMVTSAAYRQSARATPELVARDPQNRWVARGPRFRMDAEMLRDVALETSGLLVEKLGGPSVKPYQPPGIFEAVRGLATKPQTWEQDKGEGTYRRSLYTFWKRQSPPPNMITLDAPPRDVSCPRRERTNTPLQALVMMNDPQWVEAARVLAQRAMKEGGETDEQKVEFIGRAVLCRELNSEERGIFVESVGRFREKFDADAGAAVGLLKVGDSRAEASGELAAWTLVASEMMNTDEAMNK